MGSEEQQEKRGLKQELDDFLMDTTAHGIKNAVRNDFWMPLKIVWLVIFLGAMAGNSYHLYTVISEYLEYPKQEVTSLGQGYVRFPYVTVCNQEPGSITAINAALANVSSPLSVMTQYVLSINQELIDYETSKGLAVDDLLGSPSGIASNLDASYIQTLAHTQEDFILSCTYKGYKCETDDFVKITTSDYWNCYTFTGSVSVGSKSISESPSNGLSLILFLESKVDDVPAFDGSYNTYSNTENSQGLRVIVHENETFPRPRSAGFNTMPGNSISVALQVQNITRLGNPYGSCVANRESSGYGGYSYTTDLCFENCLATHIIENCDCIDIDYYIPEKYSLDDYKYCLDFSDGFSNFAERLECRDNAVDEFFENENDVRDNCNCIEPCARVEQTMTISESKWPAPIYMRDMFSEFVEGHPVAENLTAYQLSSIIFDDNRTLDMIDYMNQNFVRLNVYFQDTNILQRSEVPSYSFGSLWSNIGGTIGLWAGLSIITIIELIFFLTRLCYICAASRRARKSEQKVIPLTEHDPTKKKSFLQK